MMPSAGRIVLYCDDDGQSWPAIVLRARGYAADLYVFRLGHARDVTGVPQGEGQFCWRWPPRVPS